MLTAKQSKRIAALARELESRDHRRRYQACREVLHLYEDVVVGNGGKTRAAKEPAKLRAMACGAFGMLGGAAEPAPASLKDYDHQRYGAFLGVSDEGSAAARIRDAFLDSPKMVVHGKPEPLVAGGSVDAERLGGAGEVPVGLDEYRDIQLACIGRVLTTTNVGTRVNARYFNDPPSVTITAPDKAKAVALAIAAAGRLLAPFFHTPDGKPRPVTFFVCFGRAVEKSTQLAVLGALKKEMRRGKICDPRVHKPGLLVRAPRGDEGPPAVRQAMAVAAESAVGEVAVSGVMRREAQERVSMPDLLNFFDKTVANKLWDEARQKGIVLRSWKVIDVDSVARNTWTSLQAAHNAGLYLGKYGMLPLTLHEADYVIGKIQSWFADWTAAPAIYVDCPTVTPSHCYDEEAAQAVCAWLDVVHKHGVRVVLIDTADKSKGRTLLKEGPHDEVGILTLDAIRDLNAHALKLGVKALWAGGITATQAYRLGELGLFGIYTTTSTARMIPVSGDYTIDPSMPNQKEPTYCGVYRVLLLLQAGFLQSRLQHMGDSAAARRLAGQAQTLIELLGQNDRDDEEAKRVLAASLESEWRRLLHKS